MSWYAPKTIPSPKLTPRLALLSGVLGSAPGENFHKSAPVFASRANRSCSPVGRYITPSFTIGVACCENPAPNPEFRRVIHVPFKVFTFDASICASVEKRVLLQSPPTRGQSAPEALRKSCADKSPASATPTRSFITLLISETESIELSFLPREEIARYS